MIKTKGIVLIALGHGYYGRMAHNMAASLKVCEPDMPIAIICNDSAMEYLKVYNISRTFDHVITAPAEAYTRNGKREYIKAKTFMYDLSPFDETIFMDADMVWMPRHKPSELFEQLKDVDFTVQNRGYLDISETDKLAKYVMWADLNEVVEAHKLKEGKYYQVHSEFVYFKKKAAVKKLFDKWKETYDNLKVNHFNFAGAIPDELPLSIAMIKTGVYPHADNYIPIFWFATEKKFPPDAVLFTDFFAFSVGGSFHNSQQKNLYNRLVQYYFNRLGLSHAWKLQNKRNFLPERRNL